MPPGGAEHSHAAAITENRKPKTQDSPSSPPAVNSKQSERGAAAGGFRLSIKNKNKQQPRSVFRFSPYFDSPLNQSEARHERAMSNISTTALVRSSLILSFSHSFTHWCSCGPWTEHWAAASSERQNPRLA